MKSGEFSRDRKMTNSTGTGEDMIDALRQSEESYHHLFNTIRQAIYIQDSDGRFVDVNDGACAMYGYTREEFIGRRPDFLAAPGLNDFNYVTEQLKKAFAGEPQQLEFWGRRKNGEIFPKDVRLYRGMYFGKVVAIVVATDITGQKQAEKTLYESEEYYRAIINTSPDNICITDLSGTILMGSKASVAMFGLPDVDAANGKNIAEFIIPEERERARQAFLSILKSGTALGEYHGLRMDGSVFPFEVNMSLMRDNRKKPWRMVAVVRDISRRRELEDSLSSTLSRSRNQQQVIAEIAVSPLVSSGNVEGLSHLITERAAHLLEVERAGIWLFDETQTRLTCTDLFTLTTGIHSSGTILQESEFRNEFAALKSAQFINADNPLSDPRTAGYVEGYIKPLRITSMLDAVIRSAGKNIGVICFEHVEKKHTWEPDECTFACQLADQMALTVTNRERITAQQGLIESDERYRAFISHSSEGIFRFETGCDIAVNLPENEQIALFARHGYLAECNDAFARMHGYEKAESLIGASFSRIMEIDSEITLDFMRTVLYSGYHIENYEAPEMDREGNTRWFSITLTGNVCKGKIVRFWGVQRDITDHKNAVKQLADSEEYSRTVISSLQTGVIIIDAATHTILELNQKALEMIGTDTDAVVGSICHRFICPAESGRCPVTDLEQTIDSSERVLLTIQGEGIPILKSVIKSNLRGREVLIESFIDITDRRNSEQKLAESNELFRAVFNNANDAVFLLERTPQGPGKYLLVNEIALRWLGYTLEEMLTMTPRDIVPKGIGQTIMSGVLEELAKSGHATFESVHQRKDGSTYPVEVSTHTFTFKEKTIDLSIARDISQRKQEQGALKKSEEKYRTLIEASPDMVWEIDSQGNFTYISPQSGTQLGYEPDELVGKSIFSLIRPEYIPSIKKQFIEHRELQESFAKLDVLAYHRDGRPLIIEIRSVVIIDEDGTVTGFRGLARDITERKNADESLRESEERLRLAQSSGNIGVWDWVLKTGTLHWSLELETMYGLNPGTIRTYNDWKQLVHPDDIGNFETDRDAAIARHESFSLQYRILHSSGEIRWIHAKGKAIYSESGEVTRVIGINIDITGPKRLEESLRELGTYNRSLIDANIDPLVTISKDGKILDVNTATENVTGVPRSELIGTDFSEYFTDPEKARAGYLRAFYEGKIINFPLSIRHRNGHITPVLYNATVYHDNNGDIKGVFAAARDITEQMKAKEALKDSEARYSALFTNNHSVSLLIDPDTGRIIDANEAAVWYYGYSRDQLIAMGIFDLNQLSEKTVIQNLQRAKNEKEKHFFSTHYLKDGEKRYVEIYSGPIRVQGKPLFYSIIHDITDRKRAELALLESEERYHTLVDSLPDYVIVHRDGILLYVNPAAASNMGYDGETLPGKAIISFIAPEHRDRIREAVSRRMAGEDLPPYEMKIIARDGTFHTVLTHGALINYQGATASLNVLTDITDRKLMEEEVKSLNRVLEQRVIDRTEELTQANTQLSAEIKGRTQAEKEISRSLKEKELLLREIHHRVKNNLQIIASLLNLQARSITDPHVRESIKDSQSRVRVMSLVHERIYRSQNFAEINLKEYLNYLTKQIIQFYATGQNVTVTVSMDNFMADIDTVIPIGLAINELVSNSLKHAFLDGRNGAISITCTPQGADKLRFVYHDNGIGMPSGFDWRKTESLGLRLVNNLVDQLDGTIESGDGEGTTFIITIPQKQDSATS